MTNIRTPNLSRIGALLLGAGFISSAALTAVAEDPQLLYTTNGASWSWRTDNFQGSVGGGFRVGANDVVVTHLGYFDKDVDGLAEDHPVGVYQAGNPSGTGLLLGEVTVPAGTGAFFTNGFRWVALASPLTLKAGSNYVLASQSPLMAGDQWPDLFAPSWNTYVVGTTPTTSRGGAYDWPYVAWPHEPSTVNPGWANGKIYGAPNLAYLPGGVVIGQHPQSATRYVSESVSFNIVAAGADGYQWYKAPSTVLAGQNANTLALTNLALGDAGSYFCKATNATSSATSSNAVLTVLAWSAPGFAAQPQPVTAYINQQVTFGALATGSPPATIAYQWKKGSTVLPDQTNTTLVLPSVTAADAGSYSVVASNSVNTAASSAALLTVITPAAGSYEAAIVAAKPVVYYRFSDIDSSSNVVNVGTLGSVTDGTAEGNYYGTDGPLQASYPNFESTNRSIALNGSDTDVLIPALNLATNVGNTVTLAAWVQKYGGQVEWSGILLHRGSGGGSGLGVKKDGLGQDMLQYHWANQQWGFTSDLVLPDYQWCFVALVIEPAKATLYLHDGISMKSTNNVAAHAVVPFGSVTRVGWDSAMASRRWSGLVDEAMIFNRALSASEVFALYSASGNDPASIVADPQSVTNYTGTPFTLSVTAGGTPPQSFQWWKQGVGAMAGATNSVYSVSAAVLGDAGNYWVVVTNRYGRATSAVATVTIVQQSPIFTAVPQSVTVWASTRATLDGAAVGSQPITYQWWKDGAPLDGQIATTLVLSNAALADAGSYVLRASNGVGSSNSPAAQLQVLDPARYDQMLFPTNGYTSLRTGYEPIIGATFRTGARAARVTHLGYFDADADGLLEPHDVGIYSKGDPSGTGTLLASVLVPAGADTLYTNGYRWVALAAPFTLLANTDYVIASSTNVLDAWPDRFIPEWNTAVVGNTAPESRYVMWDWPFVAWPHEPGSAGTGDADLNRTYGAFNLGYFPVFLTIEKSGNNVILTWPRGTLQQSDTVNGTYTDLIVTSPHTVPATGAAKFFRVKLN